MAELGKLVIFTDGGARGNPGPAGIGAVLYADDAQGIKRELAKSKSILAWRPIILRSIPL